MIIERLDLSAFGLFTDVSLDLSAGPRRFHLIYGPNESGKSTSLRAITSLLFGMPHITEDNFLHTNAQMRVGGILTDDQGNTLHCVRRRGRKGTLRDGRDAEVIDEDSLHRMLGGIDRETFLSRFGLSHDELIAGGSAILAGDGDLGEILFSAGAGVSQLRDVQVELDEASRQLFSPRGSKCINASIKELDQRRRELRQAQLPPAAYAALEQKIERKREAAAGIAQSIQDAVIGLAKLKSFQQALPLVPPWRSDIQTLAELADTPVLDDAFTERRRQVESEYEMAVRAEQDLHARLQELTSRLEALPEDKAVMSHEAEIQTLFQELAARDKADRDRLDLMRVQRNADRKITDLLRELSVEILSEDDVEASDAINDSVQRLRVSDSLRTRVHELAAQHERLVQQRDDAGDQVATLRKRIADTTRELELLGAPGDPTSLAGVLDAVGPPATLLESLAEQQEDCDQLERTCEAQCRRLEGFSGTFQQAARLQPPSHSVIDRVSEQMRRAGDGLGAARDRLEALRRQRDDANQQLELRLSGVPLPTVQQLQDSRDHRDRAVEQLGQRSRESEDLGQAIESVLQTIRESDKIADTIRAHHEEVSQRAVQSERVRALDRQLELAEAEVQSLSADLQSAGQQWKAIWEACDVSADTPERMKRWLVEHEQLVNNVARLEEQQKRVDQAQRRVHRATERLRSAVASLVSSKAVSVNSSLTQVGLFDDEPIQDLVTLYDDAVSLRSDLSRLRQQQDSLSRRRDELTEELPLAETRLATYEKNVQQWNDDWQRVTRSFVESEHSSPTVVMSTLRRIDELCEKKRERDILATRIRSIGEDEHSFQSRVGRVADALGIPESDDGQSGATAQNLYQRLQAERTASRQRDILGQQIEEAKQKSSQIGHKKADCEIALQKLCDESRCPDAGQLPEMERKSRRKQQVEMSLRDLENQLTLLAGDDSIEDFVAAAGEQQPALLDVEIERQEQELAELRRQMSNADQEIGGLRHELESVSQSSRAAELLQATQLLAGEISRNAMEYARLKVASLILRRAVDHYRQENQNPVLKLAEGFFSQLTCGEYQSLKVDYDAKGKSILFAVRAGDSSVDVPSPAMSSGTADALYLALRLASLSHQLSHGTTIPLIVDDCLIQLDDQRSVAAMRAFSELSEKTQVILFTHHRHLIDLANQELRPDEVHVHRLDAI